MKPFKLLLAIVTVFISITALTVYSNYKDQKVKIIYFTNENCIVNRVTDRLIQNITADFGERIQVETVIISLYLFDPPDSAETKQLREKYQVYGAPTIIINEKEFKKEYKYEILKAEICKDFVVKPLVCL